MENLFFDIMINKDPETSNIWMVILYKKVDTRRCVPFNPCHQKQCKNIIPFTLARRICTIVENSEVRKQRFDKLQKCLFAKRICTIVENSKVRKKRLDKLQKCFFFLKNIRII